MLQSHPLVKVLGSVQGKCKRYDRDVLTKGWSNLILLRKLKYIICGLRSLFIYSI